MARREIQPNGTGTWAEQTADILLRIGRLEFNLEEVYAFENELAEKHPQNKFVREKIRQKLQELRDADFLEFVTPGTYRLKPRR
ncbi:MAG: hypothetical protein J0H54_03855 [Rhizobiales bacterium]|nr:hypothetical protein [Hyphomicrobiales bacterium]